ncbi:ExbD/TolR family protein [Planctomicrobium sp. SH661]|uniref:ExbD/TolR family protein n=1 Tax=Planctomicrobium sp. SH661 TaxID=3448124 RepID=UPI003F5C11AD
MRRPISPRKRGFELNLTPLIDVVFNLVIFFLVASHFASTEPAEEINLPTASRNEDDVNPRRLTITVHADGAYSVASKTVTLTEIQEYLELEAAGGPQECAVRIRGDKSAPYKYIEPVMVACARHGITNFGFKVINSP